MAEKAKKESYSEEVASFIDKLYGDHKGYVYAPTKEKSGFWQEYYFKWPENRKAIISHILVRSKTEDVYVAPSMFKAPSAKRQAWKGSQFVWVEFDGNAPEKTPKGIPEPSIRIQSSEDKHEHWYWQLQEFNSEIKSLEGLAKQLTYTLDADKSGWDANQVLRPPGTLHQESTRRVRLLTSNDNTFGFEDFRNLVSVQDSAVAETTFDNLPDIKDVVAKYSWDEEAYDLFQKPTQAVGSRSSAMTRLGFHCIEMGMSNEECYVVLLNADERWGKYKHRSPANRAKRLIGIITHCRGKKELDTELRLSERESFVSLGDFRTSDLKVNWLYDNFLIERGLGIISSAPGVGKSTLSIRFGFSAALGTDFLVWANSTRRNLKVGFLSLEMSGMECLHFTNNMMTDMPEKDKEIIDKNFFLLPLGYSLDLSHKDNQQAILDGIDRHELDFIIIDSLKAATGLDEKKTDKFFDWINKHVRDQRGCSVWTVHHNRKPPNEGSRKPKDLSDLYGDTFITAYPSTVISLWRKNKRDIEVNPMKIRLAESMDPFTIQRSGNMNFTVQEKSLEELEQEESDNSVISERVQSRGLFNKFTP